MEKLEPGREQRSRTWPTQKSFGWITQRKLDGCSGQAGLGTYLFPPRLSGRDGEGFKFNAAELMQ